MTGGQYGSIAATAVVMFAGTNIDDALVLTALNVAAHSTGAPSHRQIWTGQYLGMAVMVAVSGLGALGLSRIPTTWVGLLGLVPTALGIRLLVKAVRGGDDQSRSPAATGLMSVLAPTVAAGGDNIAVYTPAFRIMGPAAFALTLAVFALGTAVWCSACYLLTSRPRSIRLLRSAGTWLVPTVFIGLGLHILHAADIFGFG